MVENEYREAYWPSLVEGRANDEDQRRGGTEDGEKMVGSEAKIGQLYWQLHRLVYPGLARARSSYGDEGKFRMEDYTQEEMIREEELSETDDFLDEGYIPIIETEIH